MTKVSQQYHDMAKIVMNSYINKSPIVCTDHETAKTISALAKSMGIELQKIIIEEKGEE